MTWFDLAVALLVTTAVVMIPGLAIAFSLGLRGLWLWAVGAAAGVSAITVAAFLAPFLGLTWGVIPVIATAALLCVVVLVLRRVLWRGERVLTPVSALSRGSVLALVGAGIIILIQVLLVIGTPTAISQTFDNIFHLNAIQFALDTGNVSPLHLGQMTSAPSGGVPFYPSGWHAIGSLVVQLTGTTITVVSNALTIFFAAVVWPLGIVLFTRTLFGSRASLVISASAIAAALPAFPLLLIEYGVLFPYMMSLSMVGVVLALIVEACTRIGGQRWAAGVAALGLMPAIAISHPGGFVAVLVFATVILAVRFLRFWRENPSPRTRWVGVAIAVIYVVVVIGAWFVLRPPAAARTWTPTETLGQAVGEVLTVSVWFAPVHLVAMIMVILGLIAAIRRRSFADWLILAVFAAAVALYLTVSGLPYAEIRDLLTGAWYNNAPRLAALLPIAWVPLAALGGEAAWAWFTARQVGKAPRKGAAIVVVVAVAAVLVVIPQLATMSKAVASAHANFAVSEASPLLTTDEWTLLTRLDESVPEDVVVVGSPWTGTGLAYALADRPVMMPHTLMDITPEMEDILNGLDTARDENSAACEAVRDIGAGFVLDFGDQEVNGGEHPFRGLDRLEYADALTLVDEEGDARLYEITGCGR